MSRYRKIYSPNGAYRVYIDDELIEGCEPVTKKYGPDILPDIEQHYGAPIISPIDGSVISSRSQLREHNIRHGVIQCGDVRGEAVRQKMKDHMYYDPSLRGKDFSWGQPD